MRLLTLGSAEKGGIREGVSLAFLGFSLACGLAPLLDLGKLQSDGAETTATEENERHPCLRD
jgi:hypothetical protein